jgi:hypothetical protein
LLEYVLAPALGQRAGCLGHANPAYKRHASPEQADHSTTQPETLLRGRAPVLVSIVQLARPGMDLRDRELSRQAAAATRARRMAQLRTKGTARDLAAGARSYVEESGKREPADSFPGLDAPAPAAAIHDPAQQLALLLDNQRQQPYVAAPAASAQSFQARLSRMQEYLVSESEPEVP